MQKVGLDKDPSLPCKHVEDRMRIAAALAETHTIPIHHINEHCWVAINRLPRSTVELPVEGETDPKTYNLFSIVTTDPTTIGRNMWVTFDRINAVMDQYTARIIMDDTVVQMWTPDGCTADDGLFGLEMWFEQEGVAYKENKILHLLKAKQDKFTAAAAEIQAALE